jgi:hypothetical protein
MGVVRITGDEFDPTLALRREAWETLGEHSPITRSPALERASPAPIRTAPADGLCLADRSKGLCSGPSKARLSLTDFGRATYRGVEVGRVPSGGQAVSPKRGQAPRWGKEGRDRDAHSGDRLPDHVGRDRSRCALRRGSFSPASFHAVRRCAHSGPAVARRKPPATVASSRS